MTRRYMPAPARDDSPVTKIAKAHLVVELADGRRQTFTLPGTQHRVQVDVRMDPMRESVDPMDFELPRAYLPGERRKVVITVTSLESTYADEPFLEMDLGEPEPSPEG